MNVRKISFTVAAVMLPILFFAALEGGLRLGGVGADGQTAFRQIPGKPEFLALNPAYVGRYFTGFKPAIAFNPFAKEKQPESFRVFVLGGSTTAGFPYQFYYGFPARLGSLLEASAPGQRIEVVNVGMTAVNSYTLWDMKNAVARQSPDAVVIYAGHNEYYGAFGAGSSVNRLGNNRMLKRTVLKLKRLASYRLLEQALRGKPRAADRNEDRTLMATVVRDATIDKDGAVFDAGVRQFSANMSDLATFFADKGIQVYLGLLTSNLQDQRPLGDNARSVERYQRGLGLILEKKVGPSRAAFIESKDSDNIRFRAPEAINGIIREVAAADGVHLIDVPARFAAASRTGIEGNDLFTDHLHPNARGYQLMAEAFFDSLQTHPNLRKVNQSSDQFAGMDAIGTRHAAIQIARLKAGFPFNKTATPEDEAAAFDQTIAASLQGGLGDSLAALVVVREKTMAQALLEAARTSRERADTTNALLYYRALLNWQPYNESLANEALSYAVNSPHHDLLVGSLAQFVVGQTNAIDALNTLGAVRIRQGRLEEADGVLARAESLDPASKVMAFNKARLLVLQGDTLRARHYFDIYRN